LARQTAASYSLLWNTEQPETRLDGSGPYHLERMERSVPVRLRGLVLDAGCGDGSDLASIARRPAVEVIGVEISAGGARVSFERTLRWPNAHVVQADVRRLPFRPGRFDYVYSYGVLHHLPEPDVGLRGLVGALAPGGMLVAYVYEDFSEQPRLWRWLLRATNQLRWVTTCLPHRALYVACWALSPAMFLLFTLPYRALRSVGVCHPFVAAIPFRHATGPMSLPGDLFDRFAPPLERRYSRVAVEWLMRCAGLSEVALVRERGWMALGVKPGG
jgi:SAM-dependent methyltransferase